MRCIVIEARNVAHEVLVNALLESQELSDAGIERNIRQQRPHERRVHTEPVCTRNLRQSRTGFIEEPCALLLEFIVGKVF